MAVSTDSCRMSDITRHRIIIFPRREQEMGEKGGGGGGVVVVVAESVERRATPGEEVPGSIPAVAACSLLVGSVSV